MLCGAFQAQPSDFEPALELSKIITLNSFAKTPDAGEENNDDVSGGVGQLANYRAIRLGAVRASIGKSFDGVQLTALAIFLSSW